MNIQRFHAPTLRDALAKARRSFGDSTLILSNRSTAGGVEVLATAEDSLSDLDHTPAASAAPAAPSKRQAAATQRTFERSNVEQDTERLAMSTLSFQEYVRERMLSKRAEQARAAAPQPAAEAPAPTPSTAAAPVAARPAKAPVAAPGVLAEASPQRIVDQLQGMQQMLEERLGALAWLGQARQNPVQSNLLLKLVRAGYSPALARRLLESMPADAAPAEAVHQTMEAIARNIRTDEADAALQDQAGILAVIGPTGVGKTTLVSKLLSRCIKAHGSTSVGLISLDTFRPGGHEQLRAQARALGVVAHMAHDRPALQELLSLFESKKMVLIDTAGFAPRDPHLREALGLASLPGIRHVLALNAAAQGETLDSAIQAYRSPQTVGAVLCKVDEAVKLGPALDVVIRHRLPLRGVCTGQRVVEDFLPARAAELVKLSMRSAGKSAFDPSADDLSLYFSGPTEAGAAPTA